MQKNQDAVHFVLRALAFAIRDAVKYFGNALEKGTKGVILRESGSGYSAAWFSAFDWGSKGREFESRYPDHFCIHIRHQLWFDGFFVTSLTR